MSTRLVTILGLGPGKEPPYYGEVVYEYGGQRASQTPLVERALCELLDPDGVVVLGTEEVEARWETSGLLARLLERTYTFRRVPAGKTDIDRWAMFETFLKALRLEPITEAGESAPPTKLVIDVTHGFRIQPVFLMSALAFTFSEWAREGIERPPDVHVVYGAYEARTDGVAPIWDLTEFLTASRWNAALDAFLRYGRADELNTLCNTQSRQSLKEAVEARAEVSTLGVHHFLRKLGAQTKEVADDLALIRTQDLLTRSVPTLLRMLDDGDCQVWLNRLPVLRGGVELLRKRLESLSAESVIDVDGLRAQAALTDLYVLLQRFSEAAVTVRESLITHYALQHADLAPLLTPPKTRGCDEQRMTVERQWGAAVALKKDCQPDPEWPAAVRLNIELSRQFQQARNDIEHGGFNDSPSSSQALRKKATMAADKLGELMREGERAEQGEPGHLASLGFLNLSNHPLATWSRRQLETARSLGYGDPLELDPPLQVVAPDASTDDVWSLATDLADRAVEAGTLGAFVSTEPTLTVALVSALQRRGVDCFTTTTCREATERVTSDGATEKTSRFEFVGWREYPRV